MNKILLTTLILSGLFTAGCSVSGQITDETQRSQKAVLGQLTGITPGSKQNVTTSGGYQISSTVGNFASSLEQTTSGGYKVYSNIQGNIISDNTYTTVSE